MTSTSNNTMRRLFETAAFVIGVPTLLLAPGCAHIQEPTNDGRSPSGYNVNQNARRHVNTAQKYEWDSVTAGTTRIVAKGGLRNDGGNSNATIECGIGPNGRLDGNNRMSVSAQGATYDIQTSSSGHLLWSGKGRDGHMEAVDTRSRQQVAVRETARGLEPDQTSFSYNEFLDAKKEIDSACRDISRLAPIPMDNDPQQSDQLRAEKQRELAETLAAMGMDVRFVERANRGHTRGLRQPRATPDQHGLRRPRATGNQQESQWRQQPNAMPSHPSGNVWRNPDTGANILTR